MSTRMYAFPAAASSSSASSIPALSTAAAPAMAPRYDAFGRQHPFVESALQRRERVAFLAKREWARRVTSWIEHTQGAEHAYNHSRGAAPGELKQKSWEAEAASIPEEEEGPYILYSSSSAPSSASASPSSSASDLSLSPAHPHPALPTHLPAVSSSNGKSGAGGRRSRRQLSLSSIDEVPEE